MSDYIKKQDVIDIINKEIESTKSYIEHNTQINIKFAVEELPTLDEKEIIRKTVERIVEKLEQQEKQYNERAKKFAEALHSWEERRNYGKACSYAHAIEIVKEECGISE